MKLEGKLSEGWFYDLEEGEGYTYINAKEETPKENINDLAT